jgi:hypothetical protein
MKRLVTLTSAAGLAVCTLATMPVQTAHAASMSSKLQKSRPLRPGPSRYLEAYPFLAESDKESDFFDPIRYIPITESSWVQFGGGARYRYETQRNPIGGQGDVEDDTFLQQRLQLHADLHLFDDALRAFVQLENTESWGKQVFSPYDESDDEVHQVFLDFGIPTYGDSDLSLRVGRQEMSFGSFVTTTNRAGPNVRLTFDGFRLQYANAEGYKFNAFAVQPVTNVQKGGFNDSSSDGGDFYGVYSTLPVTDSIDTDVYAYGRNRDVRTLNGVTGEESRKSVGIRPNGNINGVDFTVDAIYQFGELADQDIKAWGLSSATGYTLENVTWKPGAALRFDAASGDNNPNDGESNTFDPLFPANGLFYGNATAVATLSNLIAVGPQFAFSPRSDLTISPTILGLWRENENDAAYLPGVRPISGTAGMDGSRLGTSYEIFTRWTPTANLTFDVIYQYYDVSKTLRDIGADDAQYAAVRANFLF